MMKSKFIVISKKGELFNVKDFLEKQNISIDFKALIKREAFGEGVINSIDDKPEYLEYAKSMGFSWEKNADIGFMNMDFKANFIHRLVKEYSRQVVHKIGLPIFEVSGSRMFDMSHPVVSAYANLYGERLFQPQIGAKKMVMGYDCSYPQFNLARNYHISYKQMPFAHFSIGECFRLEQSGECMLFYRGRQFNMPDLHPYFKDIDESFEWFPKIEKQIANVIHDAKREFVISLSVSSQEHFDKYVKHIKDIAVRNNQDILVEIPLKDQDKYWIINVDYKIIDALGQSREIACIQIDVENAKRLGIKYVDGDGKENFPIIIHAAVSGGIERYLYMVFDNFKNYFPIWLSPVQLRLIPVSEKYVSACQDILDKLVDRKARIDIDDRSGSVSKRIKLSKQEHIPHYVVIGEKEFEMENIPDIENIISMIESKSLEKPFFPIEWPVLVSQQLR